MQVQLGLGQALDEAGEVAQSLQISRPGPRAGRSGRCRPTRFQPMSDYVSPVFSRSDGVQITCHDLACFRSPAPTRAGRCSPRPRLVNPAPVTGADERHGHECSLVDTRLGLRFARASAPRIPDSFRPRSPRADDRVSVVEPRVWLSSAHRRARAEAPEQPKLLPLLLSSGLASPAPAVGASAASASSPARAIVAAILACACTDAVYIGLCRRRFRQPSGLGGRRCARARCPQRSRAVEAVDQGAADGLRPPERPSTPFQRQARSSSARTIELTCWSRTSASTSFVVTSGGLSSVAIL